MSTIYCNTCKRDESYTITQSEYIARCGKCATPVGEFDGEDVIPFTVIDRCYPDYEKPQT